MVQEVIVSLIKANSNDADSVVAIGDTFPRIKGKDKTLISFI